MIDRLYAGHPRGYLLSDWVFPPPTRTAEERRRAEERLMQLDIAVESVMTANGAMHALLSRLLGRIRRDGRPQHRRALGAADRRGLLDLDSDERLRRVLRRAAPRLRRRVPRHDIARAVLLAVGTDAASALEIAAPGRRRAAPGDGQLPAPGGARRRGRRGHASA